MRFPATAIDWPTSTPRSILAKVLTSTSHSALSHVLCFHRCLRLGGRNSSRKLTVNIHETTCSTSFCINKNVWLLWIRLNMRQEAFPKPIGTHARKNHLFDNESKNGSAAKHIYQTFLGTIVATSEPLSWVPFLPAASQVFNIWMIFCARLFVCLFFISLSNFFPWAFLFSTSRPFSSNIKSACSKFREIIQFGCGEFSNESRTSSRTKRFSH